MDDSKDIFDIPLMNIIHLMLWAGVDISQLEESIRQALSYFSGYNNSYGFEDKKDVGDIIFSDELKVTYDNHYHSRHFNFQFFLKERKIKKVTLNSKKELQLVFDKEYNKRDTVEYVGESSFAAYLSYCYNNSYFAVPVPLGFEDSAVNKKAGKFSTRYISWLLNIFEDSGTYMTYLWDEFDKIKETYTERIKNGEDIEKLADEIVPESRTDKKPATNVLRNICYDRAFNTKLSYDEAWKKVRDTYRKFVIKVLGAVKWLSEHEDELKKTDDDNNEEME